MPLAAGQNLTYYEILGPLGAGGMGEVYRAKDTRLEREVAIKVLPEELADDEDRLRRFEREAKTLASLNHPNVAGIHGVDQVDDVCFLALELVPGEDLATRLSHGPLPVDEAIDVCRQIAEGLEAAHEAGVVHRDLKPANVRVTPDGVVKILDFGLAKPIRPKADEAGTSTSESDSFLMTEDGVVLGTPTYMSPEQARGRAVDRRTDLWALGCVLYECLTGARAFHGESIPDIFAAIVEREPDWSKLPPGTPPGVAALLRRAFEKEPRTRLRDAGEARVLLEHVRSGSAAGWGGLATVGGAPAAGGEGRRSSGLALAAVAVLAVLAGALASRVLWPAAAAEEMPAQPERPERHFVVLDKRTMPDGVPFSTDSLAVSPDGTQLVTAPTEGGFLVHSLGGLTPIHVPFPDGVEEARSLAWTPDSREIVYADGGAIRRFVPPGGPHLLVAETEAWAGDLAVVGETVLFSFGPDQAFHQVPLRGGVPEVYGEPPPDGSHFDGVVGIQGMDELLGIRHVSTGREGTGERKWLAIVGPEGSRDLIEIEPEDENACLVAGHVVLERGGEKPALWAYPFSRDDLAITGEPFFLWPGTSPVASRDGDLFYLSEGSEGMRQLAWLDEDGELELFDQPRATNAWAQGVSPDGSRVAFADGKEIWVHDVEQERSVMVATVEERIASLHYLPGYRILVVAMGKALLLPDGPGEAVEWDVPGMVMSVSLDGSRALVSDMAERRLLLQPLRDAMPAGEPEVLREGVRGFSSMSPDGRWYLFSSDHSGAEQYYLSRYPDTGEVWTLGIGGTVFVMFGPRGDEILVAALTGRRTLSAMSFTPDPEPRFGALETRFDLGELGIHSIFFPFDPTSGRFVVNKWSAPSDTRIVLVQNWRGPDAER